MNKKKLKRKGLPTYEIVVNMEDETGVRLVSLVKSPAIELKGMYFNEDDTEIVEKELMFVSNKDEQMIIGPALVPYKKIYRVDPDTGEEYNVVFTPNSIKNIVNKFNKSNNNKSINLEHTNQMVDGYIAENWIVKNSVYDTSRAYGLSLQEGSWVICVKIEDKNFWNNEVKEQGIYGFSVEGLLGQKLISLSRLELSGEKISFDYHGVLNTDKGMAKAKQMISDGYDVYIVTDASKDRSGGLISEVAKELGIPESKVIYAEGNKPKVLKELGIKAHYDNNSNIVDKIDKGGVVDGRQFEEMLSKLNEEETIELYENLIEYIEVEFGRKRYDAQPSEFNSYWFTHKNCNYSFSDGSWTFEPSPDGKYPCELCKNMASKYESWYAKRGTGSSAAPGSKSFSKIEEKFVEPNKGEKEDEFIGRCIKYVMDKGETEDEKQAYAICKTKWDNK